MTDLRQGVPAADAQAVAWLFSLQRFGMRPGLDRARSLLDALERPDARFATVLVAGTNGKGATTAALAAMLRCAGTRTGRFVSPHLTRPGERVAVDDRPLDEAVFARYARTVRPAAEAAGATFFEVLVALAALAFAEAGVETAVFEVGLGGRLDATNALDPIGAIVTNVALDHTAVLGPDVASIAAEKAGVLRPGRPAWTAARGAGLGVLRREARARGAELEVLGRDVGFSARSRAWHGLELALGGEGDDTLRLRTPWLGRHAGASVALAARAARGLGAPPEAVVAGAARARWPGRLEPLRHQGRRVLLDGAHNPAAAAALARALADLGLHRPPLVLGLADDKDLAGVAAVLRPRIGPVIATRARHSPRALAPERVAAAFPGATVEPDPHRAVAAALHGAAPGATVVVAGSLYLVGEIRPWLLGEAAPPFERWQ